MTRRTWTPPIIPARRVGWERAYAEVMARHVPLPLDWALSDCLRMPADLCKAMTGVDPMKGLRRYRTEAGAMKTLLKAGFRSVEEALEAVFPEIAPARARRGDCGVLEQSIDGRPWLSTLIVMGDKAVGKGLAGPAFVPVSQLKRTFAIGAP